MALTKLQITMIEGQTTSSQAFSVPDPIYENTQNVTANYCITTGSSAMSAGPITLASGAVITIPTGSRWIIL